MRVLTERMKGRETDVLDGIKVFDERGWVQILPDPGEPIVHVYAEGATHDESALLEAEFVALIEQIIAGVDDGVPAGTAINPQVEVDA